MAREDHGNRIIDNGCQLSTTSLVEFRSHSAIKVPALTAQPRIDLRVALATLAIDLLDKFLLMLRPQ